MRQRPVITSESHADGDSPDDNDTVAYEAESNRGPELTPPARGHIMESIHNDTVINSEHKPALCASPSLEN